MITTTPVAIPTPISPKMLMVTAVAMAAARVLTILFPIRIVVNTRCGDSFKAARDSAPFLPSLTRVRTFARVIEMRATSELEKNAERMMQMTKSRSSKTASIIGSTPQKRPITLYGSYMRFLVVYRAF
jgi:hypothetical protein